MHPRQPNFSHLGIHWRSHGPIRGQKVVKRLAQYCTFSYTRQKRCTLRIDWPCRVNRRVSLPEKGHFSAPKAFKKHHTTYPWPRGPPRGFCCPEKHPLKPYGSPKGYNMWQKTILKAPKVLENRPPNSPQKTKSSPRWTLIKIWQE